jgi:hypothetical protein
MSPEVTILGVLLTDEKIEAILKSTSWNVKEMAAFRYGLEKARYLYEQDRAERQKVLDEAVSLIDRMVNATRSGEALYQWRVEGRRFLAAHSTDSSAAQEGR